MAEIFFQFFKNWWWFFFSFILYFIFRYLYFWWIRWEVFYKKAFKWILLELKPPKENIKPFSAMENIFSMFASLHDIPNWRGRWCEGGLPIGYGGWFSFEICSFGGETHFFIRIPDKYKTAIETAIYSQYPDSEVSLVEDYTQKIPRDIPNEKWDLYSEDYTLFKPDHFPIKTYSMFFERPEEEKRVLEEKRLDPMTTLMEAFSKLQSGEQLWLQIVGAPIIEKQFPWIVKGKAEVDRITKRVSPKPQKSILEEIFDLLIFGKKEEKKEEIPLELVAPELRLTPVEREIVSGIENKMKKPAFLCWIRQVYLCKRDEPHNFGNFNLVREYLMSQFATNHLNTFVYFGGTRTRIHYWLKRRRLYLRKRQRLRNYIERMPSLWPRSFEGTKFPGPISVAPGIRATCVLNTEELATIFHFPTKIILPTVPRVETKRVGPPPHLS